MDELEIFLQKLLYSENLPQKSDIIKKRIPELFRKEKSGESVKLLIFLIFNENGIISYIRRRLISQESKSNILHAFQLLEFILINYKNFSVSYVCKVVDLCLEIIESGAPAKVKENATKLLKCLFTVPFLGILPISRIITTIKEAINRFEKIQPSVLSQFFSIMGIIFETVPEISYGESDIFIQLFICKIRKNRQKILLMEGCLNGIYGYLVNFVPSKEQISEIYSMVKDFCTLKKEQIRRIAERAALRIVERHYRIFAMKFYEDIKFWRETLGIWMSRTKEDSQLGFAALVSVYRAIAYVFESSKKEIATEKLNEVVEEMLKELMVSFKLVSMAGVVELISTGHVREDLVNQVFQLLTKRAQTSIDNFLYLYFNLECLSKYMTRSKTVKPELLVIVERLAIALIDKYPRIESDFQQRSLETLRKSFYHLEQCGDQVLDEYANEMIYQGLIRNCSHQVLTDVELISDITDTDLLSYKSFLPIWTYLLNPSSSDRATDGSVDVKLSEKILDKYIESFLKINKKLDLRIEIKSPHATDPEEVGVAVRPNDFKIFVNNVSLFVDVMEDMKNPDAMSKWLPWIFTETINSSYRSPLISGCYKVITSCLKMADKISYFWDPFYDQLKQPDCKSDIWFKNLHKFLQDVAIKVGGYKGELQISCFQVFLSTPVELIEPLLWNLVPVFRVILQVGSRHLPILRDCLSTLEKWYTDLGRDDSSRKESITYLLKNILPHFNVFLQYNENHNNMNETVEMKWKPLKVKGQIERLHSNGSESELLSLQRKFLHFLGMLDYDICKELIRPIDNYYFDNDNEMREWSKKLSYDFPLSDMNLRIHLDELIPRIIELSLSSTDRQTRLNACEFLHSMMLLIIGKMKQMNGELNGLFRKLLNVCLILGCDSDLIVFQIYEPFMMQLVHYFARKQTESSQIFINCLMESASFPFNPSVRELAGKLIRVFTEWSIKDQDPGETSSNLKLILKIMYSFFTHPDHNKWFGAAIVFNNICSILQEETDILNSHWFLLYFHFMECLEMCSVHDDMTHIINAVEYIIVSINDKSLKSQLEAPSWFKNDSVNNILEFVFNRCSHRKRNIRKLSMSLYEKIGKWSFPVKEFVRIHGFGMFTNPEYPMENSSMKDYITWLEYFSAIFGYYDWLLSHEAVTEIDMRMAGLETSLGIFLDNLSSSHSGFEIHTKRIDAIIEMFQFLRSCIRIGIVWHLKKVLNMVKACLFTPSEFNFELAYMENYDKLDLIFADLLPSLVSRLNKQEMNYFVDLHLDFSRLNTFLHPDRSLSEMIERINGLKRIHRLGLWDLGFNRIIVGNEILKSVFESLFHTKPKGALSVNLRSDEKMFFEDLLRFGMKIGMSMDTILDFLANSEEIYDVNTSEKMTKGEFFSHLFKEFIYDCILTNSETCLNDIFEKLQNVLDIVINLLKYIRLTTFDKKKFIFNLCHRCPLFERLTHDKALLLSIIKLMCMVDSDLLTRESQISSMIYQIMKTTSNFGEIVAIFEVIPYLSLLHEDSNEKLTSSLDVFYQNQKFNSTDVSSSDPMVATVYDGLLKGFTHTKSLPILQEIIKMLKIFGSLLNESEIDNIMNDVCQSKVPKGHIEKILMFLYGNMVNDVKDSLIYQCFLEKLLKKCDRESALKFLLENLIEAVNVLKCENLSLRIAILEMIQACLIGIKKEALDNTSEGMREAFKNLIWICLKIKYTDSELELQRKYFCTCFNTLCTIVASKSNDPFQYKCLIFKEDFSFLPYLINREKVWHLRMDFDELPKKVKVLTSIRKTITKERQMKIGTSINSVNYLEEETLFDSSLREDVTKFDCMSCFIGTAYDHDRELMPQFDIELEMDELNNHECMATMIGIIEHMVDAKITPEDIRSVPFWLLAIMNRMTSLISSENEKIFLLKLMCNIDRCVKPYAERIIPDILNTLIDVFDEQPINYLIIDIIVMILNWKCDLSSLDERIQGIITRLTIYIVNKSDSYQNNIIKSNIEIVKLIVETCKDIMKVHILSAKAFEEMTKQEGLSASRIYTNLHFCGVLLANSIPPWLDNKEEEFLLSVIKLWGSSDKLEKLAARICGLTLHYLENTDCEGRLSRLVYDKLENLIYCRGLNNLSLMYNVFKNFDKVSTCFVNSIRVCAWTIRGPYQLMSLEMLLGYFKRLDSLDYKFDYIINSFIDDMSTTDDLEIVNLSLQIAEVVLRISDKDMTPLVEKVLTFRGCKLVGVRRTVYNVAIMIFDQWEDRFSRTMNEDIIKQCKILLLNGMNDNDFDCREQCLQFWQRKSKGLSSAEQFSSFLHDVYTAETEESFLNFVTRLMIRSAVSDDFQSFLFEHPLIQNSSFRVRNLVKTGQTSTIAPMFAQTLTGQLNKSGLLQSLSSGPSLLQSLLIQATIQEGGENSSESNLDNEGHLKNRRFIRSPPKMHFAKMKKMKKIELQSKAKAKNKIELLREYFDGDFPNIQITHRDLLKPLEMLTTRDSQMGRYFLTSLYDGFMERIPDKSFFENIRKFVEQVIKKSTQNNPSFIAFLFHVLLRCNGSVQVESEWVARVAKSSGCLFLGKLLIEGMIIQMEWDEEVRDRRLGITPEEKKWLNLAEICRKLKEIELIRGIFLHKLRVVDAAADAIRFESISDWFRASELYESVLKKSLPPFSNYYEDAYSNCLARLSDWTKLSNHIQESYQMDDLWSDLTLSEKILPWFLKSETMRSLLSDGGKSIMDLVNKFQSFPDRVSDLKRFFAEELAIAHFSQGNFDYLHYYLYYIFRDFLLSWSHNNQWRNTMSLMELQVPWELENCHSALTSTDDDISDFLNQWSRNRPKDGDDLMIWDKRLTCRNHFLSMFESYYPESDKTKAMKSSILADFDMVKSGIAQRNFHISQKYMERIRERMESFKDPEVELMHKYYMNSLNILKEELYSSDRDARCINYASMVHLLEEISDNRETSFESYILLSRIMDLLERDIHNVSESTIQEIGIRLRFRLQNVKENIEAMKLQYLGKALENADGDADLTSKTFMEIVKYCRINDVYSTEMAKFLLRAMIGRNSQARQLFCCLLNEPKFAADWLSDSDLRSICKRIPTWMYLMWTNQILANLDSEMFPFLREILLSLSEEYPNSIRYSFGLSKETYNFTHSKYGKQCRLFVEELSRKLFSDSSHMDFLTALSFVTPPDLVFRYDLDILITELNRIQPDWNRMTAVVRDLYERMYGENYKIFRGSIFDCLNHLKPDLEALLTLNHEKSLWMEKIGRMLKVMPKVSTENCSLKSYSPWLYRSINRKATFELPCRQDGDLPILNRSVTIWSFKSDILVMKSKCRPIRITVLGNDAREYKFLVKFGEDLRQDQRIQQVFSHMNQILLENPQTSTLFIGTYNVLPLKLNLGMIEWVNNTSSMYDLLIKTDEQLRRTIESVQQEHLKFLAQDSNIGKAIDAHLNGYLKIGQTEAVTKFHERVHSFKWDLLRKAFCNMSLCPEQFVHLRSNFAASQAVIYIAHWLVGIGDRHLDNTLISAATGRALGIDFGYAFGFATEFLTPPELVPFRLTPQIVNLLTPMGENVLIKETMIQCLRAFRLERSILITELQVFASEPTLSWFEKTKRDQKSRNDDSEYNGKWNPQQKIAAVKEKLDGINPVKIFSDDLISGHTNTQHLEKYLQVLYGDGSRSRFNSFTEQEQVDCLIELATDPHILCKTYVGWNPWL